MQNQKAGGQRHHTAFSAAVGIEIWGKESPIIEDGLTFLKHGYHT